ncbi:MAG: helicase-exonuclease AddAB subunit AddA [Clostridia bacterium]|nr:helicase-exonuclease AddAB subunit AddA [Clostridia bacterium]
MPNWTPQQLDAITDRGHSLIVCAAAGSGKTAVLVERIVRLVREGCPVDRLLVVTFTNAAAGEMRLRIGEALTKAAQEEPELAVQATALSRASISTLHRFCGGLLRENFQALGIDPAFRIGDEQECGVLSQQAMEDALYACYEVGSEAFRAADACYTQEELASIARGVYAFMMTRPDPKAWLDSAAAACTTDEAAIGSGPAAAFLVGDAQTALLHLRKEAAAALALCRGEMGPLHYEAACAQDAAMIDDLLDAAGRGYSALRSALTGVAYATLGRKKKGDLFDEGIAEAVKARRDAMKKRIRDLEKRFAPSLSEAAEDLEMTRAPLEGICELVRTYEALYAAAKRRRGVLDFNDLEHEALRALTHEEVRAALAERYRYVFVDEYQDSSAIQEAILGQFAPEDGQFLVGDVKQSIYRFRQAEPALFLEKAKRYDLPQTACARRIDLQSNFRSRANVLAGVNAVFENIMRADVTEIEYDERERLIPGLPVREDDPPVELHVIYRDGLPPEDGEDTPEGEEEQARELAAAEQEALVAAQRIRALVGTPFYDAKTGAERPLAYRDVAVLMRAARGCAPLAADVLSGEGIPVFCDAGEGYFDIPEIRQMMVLLAVIDNGAQDEPLLAALAGPALGLSDEELSLIRIHTADTKVPYHEAVRRYREEMEDGLAQKLRGFEARLALWRLCARHQGADRLIERIYAETGFPAQAGALPGGAARQANLHLLTSRARAFMRGQGGSLHAFLRYAARLRAGGDSMSASAIGESENVVRIMTTHKSKGLEFPVVIVLGMGRKFGGQTKRARVLMHAQLGVALPCVDTELGSERDTILHRAIRLRTEREQLAEEVRILYVAMTRARERLILIGEQEGAGPKPIWSDGCGPDAIASMRTGLDMVAPVLMQAGASLTIREEEIRAGDSLWHVYAHEAGSAAQRPGRTQEDVLRLIAPLEAAQATQEQRELMDFDPALGRSALRKTSVSRVLRDEKRAAQEARDPEGDAHTDRPPERLPRFMQERRMSGAQIGTAFHRMMCMTDLSALRGAARMEEELARQREEMLGTGVITEAEAQAVPLSMLVGFFASPVGVRMLAAQEVEREWAFTWRRTAPDGQAQLLQGVIDCCFIENGKWVLVDYKTDSAARIPEASGEHRGQVEIYAGALEALTGRPVAERILFFVRAGAGYAV